VTATARLRRRSTTSHVLGLGIALGVLAALVLASLAIGAKPIPPGTVLRALFRWHRSGDDQAIIGDLRVARTVVGLLAGASLGLAGAVMQAITRNPIADPGILGVNAGAAFALVLAIRVLGVTAAPLQVWFAFAGAAAAAVVVYLIGAHRRGPGGPATLALAGAAVTALLASATSTVLLFDLATLDEFRFWAVGSVAGQTTELALQLAPFVVVGAVLALGSARLLNALALGDDVARSLGQHVGRARLAAITSIVLLVGASVSLAGPIAFVGLAVPHVARMVTGPDNRWLLPLAAVLGAILLLGTDILGRLIARPGEIEVGVVTALVGGPVFVALVRWHHSVGR